MWNLIKRWWNRGSGGQLNVPAPEEETEDQSMYYTNLNYNDVPCNSAVYTYVSGVAYNITLVSADSIDWEDYTIRPDRIMLIRTEPEQITTKAQLEKDLEKYV